MREWYESLPSAVRTALLVVFGSIVLVAVLLFYDWVGATFLDSGGAIG